MDSIGANRGAGIDELLLNENFLLMYSILQLNTEVSLYIAMVFTSLSAQIPSKRHRNTMKSRTLVGQTFKYRLS